MIIKPVDLSDYRDGSEQDRQQFIADIGASFADTGFAVVGNHDLSDADQTELYREIEGFFALPVAQKAAYTRDDIHGQRGYNGFKSEQAKGHRAADLKEFWHHGQSPQPDQDTLDGQYENIAVAEQPTFTPALESAYRKLEHSAVDILAAIAEYLALPVDYFDAKVAGGLSILRALHYPPITEEPDSSIRAAAHEDINLITLLIGASAGGLELLTKQGEWCAVTPPEGYLVINVGDMLQRLTNKKLVSTTHRVVNPPRESWHTSRYSVPFFLHPRADTDLTCLESCVDAANPKQFSDMTAGEYLAERLSEIRTQQQAS